MRFSVISLNLWNTEYLDKRLPAITSFLDTYKADIFCFQEIRKDLIDIFDSRLEGYSRINGSDPGWMCESNIYYNRKMFEEIRHGRIDLDMPETHRGVFWVELKDKKEGKSFFASTVHLTWQGNADEMATGLSYRHREALAIAEKFPAIYKNEAVFITGDFNDPVHPSTILEKQAGFKDVFTFLHEPHPVTFPNLAFTDEYYLCEAIDKFMYIGFRPLMACSPHYYMPQSGLSDHYPLAVMLEL